MKLNKKIIITFLLVALIGVFCLSFVACDIQSTDDDEVPDLDTDELTQILNKYDDLGYTYEYSGEAVEITMAHWDSSGANIERTVIEALLEGFNKRYPNITVKLDILQDYENTYGNRIGAGTAHDVFLVPDGAISKWASSGVLENLDPYINASDILNNGDGMSTIYASCLTRYQYNPSTGKMGSGNQLALPKDVGPYVMFYNKTWFESMGVELPPSDRIMTMDEATAMWQALTKKNSSNVITGYGVAGLCIEGLVWSAGGDFLNETRTAFPTDATTLAGLAKGYQYMKDSYLTYEIQPPAEFTGTLDATQLFSQQKVASVIAGRWNVSSFRSLTFDWDIAYVPAFSENSTANMYSGSVGYAVNANSGAKKEAAWKLVEYIASREGQEILTATGFQIPVYEDLALDEDLVAKEKEKGPYNYEIFVNSAKMQGYGLWQYCRSNTWKVNGYDVPSEYLYSTNPDTEISVEEFLGRAENLVNSNLG